MDFPYNVNIMFVCKRSIDQSDPDVAEAVQFLEDYVLHNRQVAEDYALKRGFGGEGPVAQAILELESMLDVNDVRNDRLL